MGARKAIGAALAAFVLLTCGTAAAAERPADRRILVLAVTPSTVAGWRADPALSPLLHEGAVALLSTRTGEDERDPGRRARAAFATLGAGVRSTADDEGHALAEALAPLGVPFVVSPGLQRSLAASPLRTVAAALPGDLRTPAVAVIDARADGSLVTQARALLNPDDLLIVLSPDPPVRDGIHLGMVAIAGQRVPAGSIRSPSTRRSGVVTLTDIAPSILDALSIEIPPSMEGRPVSVDARAGGAAGQIGSLERSLVVAHGARRPLTRGMLALAMASVALALLMLWRGTTVGRVPVTALLSISAAAPLSLYLVGALRPSSVQAAVLESIAIAVFVGTATLALGRARALIVILGLTAAVPIADLLAGAPLAVRSPLAFQIAGGGRFYGVDDGVLGVVVGAQLLAAGLILDRARDRRVTWALAAWIALSVWVLGSPSYGSKFGAALTAVPAFGVMAVRAGGRRLDMRAVASIASVAVLTTVLLVLSDAVRAPEAQTHVARAASGRGDLAGTLARKIEATWDITLHNIWSRAIVVFAAALFVLRKMRFRPSVAYRAAMLGIVVGSVAGIVFNDEGVITATPMLLLAATASFALALGPGEEPPASPSAPPPPLPLAASN